MKKEKAILIQKEYEVEGQGYRKAAEPMAGEPGRGGGVSKERHVPSARRRDTLRVTVEAGKKLAVLLG